MGENINAKGIGEPINHWKKPDVGGAQVVTAPQTNDEFNNKQLGLQWQADPGVGDWAVKKAYLV